MQGKIRFYHGENIGPWISIAVENDAAREILLRRLCADPEVEGFEGEWEPSIPSFAPENTADAVE